MAVATATPATRSPADPRRWWVLAVMSLSIFMIFVDGTVVNTALPAISRDLPRDERRELRLAQRRLRAELAKALVAEGALGRVSPSRGDENDTPSSWMRTRSAIEVIWNPPLSVSHGPRQPVKPWRPPAAATTASPGRSWRWYVFARTIWAPSATRSRGSMLRTAPWVPTGMNAGVSTTP